MFKNHWRTHYRLVKTLPCIAVFMSSLTIVVIAIDRYLVICRPAQRQVSIRKDTSSSVVLLKDRSASGQIPRHLSPCSKTGQQQDRYLVICRPAQRQVSIRTDTSSSVALLKDRLASGQIPRHLSPCSKTGQHKERYLVICRPAQRQVSITSVRTDIFSSYRPIHRQVGIREEKYLFI